MSRMAFERIAEGLNEALSVARGETKPAKLHVPAEIDVRAIHAKLHESQEDFAAWYGSIKSKIGSRAAHGQSGAFAPISC